MTRRILVFGYGLVSYAVGFSVLLYLIAFIGNFWAPTTIDGPLVGSLASAAAINLGLILTFAVQHSVMARPAFKQRLARWIPPEAERSTYVLASGLVLIALFVLWRPMGGIVWDIQQPLARTALFALFACGWVTVFGSSFLINHFDLFGLRQVWLCLRGKPYTPLAFKTPGPYSLVRHPLYVGWLTAAWATPTMGAAHLAFAVLMTVYILAAIRWEERDLVDALGQDYTEYQERVPMLAPRLLRRRKSGTIQVENAAA
ncbi:hypothetical protein Pla123a_02510 [Posidoniimonas polymericola]|uniref:methanethiol S-methyltransferase n=1 Tax=Posidoniimonas polymericola TaxID=2528002 RepID=A0A5C5ZDM2_9BACT|nr:methanethiol S-methyltransferase [Posidoniimonas polymericola]TWT85444.1 hypothetical protein Pla123a_02510 [Posidoniimonas polymericola]